MRISTSNKRRRRNRWKRRGHTLLHASRGIWFRMPLELAGLGAQCTASGKEQPTFYRYYK
jgi:hypothetical protein